MNWKIKSKIQNVVSLLPTSLSYEMYYWMQRHMGGLRRLNPVSRLTRGIDIWNRITRAGGVPKGKAFFEIGTGRAPLVPMAFWLMGAGRTTTIDLNPYVKGELVDEYLRYIAVNKEMISGLFGPLLDKQRFNRLLDFYNNERFSLRSFLRLCCIDYIAPGDAADTRLPADSMDFQISCTVFEHIPPRVLDRIVKEGNRIVKPDGLFVHRIDYSDHFSHSDKSISAINFLQYSDNEWNRYAGNKYMYMNRMRHDDFVGMFEANGQRIIEALTDVDHSLAGLLESKRISLDGRFIAKSPQVLAITGAWIVSQKNV